MTSIPWSRGFRLRAAPAGNDTSWEAAGTTQSPSAGGRDPCPEPKGSHTALCAQTGDKGARGTEIQRWGLREDHP